MAACSRSPNRLRLEGLQAPSIPVNRSLWRLFWQPSSPAPLHCTRLTQKLTQLASLRADKTMRHNEQGLDPSLQAARFAGPARQETDGGFPACGDWAGPTNSYASLSWKPQSWTALC